MNRATRRLKNYADRVFSQRFYKPEFLDELTTIKFRRTPNGAFIQKMLVNACDPERGQTSAHEPTVVVGVVTPREHLFKLWVRENGVEGELYRQIREIDDIRGREFLRIERGYSYYDVDEQVYHAALNRITT